MKQESWKEERKVFCAGKGVILKNGQCPKSKNGLGLSKNSFLSSVAFPHICFSLTFFFVFIKKWGQCHENSHKDPQSSMEALH